VKIAWSPADPHPTAGLVRGAGPRPRRRDCRGPAGRPASLRASWTRSMQGESGAATTGRHGMRPEFPQIGRLARGLPRPSRRA